MKVADVFKYIDWYFPFMTATDYDNVGLIIGDMNDDVSDIVVTLDCTKAAIAFAKEKGANLIVTHHPVIFDPVRRIPSDSIVAECIKAGISVISAHTNLDTGKGGINDCICSLLALERVGGLYLDGFLIRTAYLAEPMKARDVAALCKERFNTAVRFTKPDKLISRVAVCSGGGGSMLDAVMGTDVDAFITGEAKHSHFMSADAADFALIECGHFETEDIILKPLIDVIKKHLPDLICHEFHGREINRI